MADRNPESVITDYFRNRVVELGGEFVKLSDRFTHGVPDCYLAFDTLRLVELKEGHYDKGVTTYQDLGVRGSQDSKIRRLHVRNPNNSCVVTAPRENPSDMRLWVPIDPHLEDRRLHNRYRLAALGEVMVMRWLGYRTSRT